MKDDMRQEDHESTERELANSTVDNRVTMIPIAVFVGVGVCIIACVLLFIWADLGDAIPFGF
jgi:hypothetical protein